MQTIAVERGRPSFGRFKSRCSFFHDGQPQPEERKNGRREGARRKEVKSRFEAPRRVLDPADRIGPDKPAEIAYGIHERDAARSGGSREERRGKRPERRLRTIDPDRRKRHRDDGPVAAGEPAHSYQADGREKARDDE